MHTWFPRKTSVDLEKIRKHVLQKAVKPEEATVGAEGGLLEVISQQLEHQAAKMQHMESQLAMYVYPCCLLLPVCFCKCYLCYAG